jgi:tetratricopeptide (TPR) repeat protein
LTCRAAGQEIDWRTDYGRARQEAAEKGRPLLIDFGTSNCVWCKKLDAGPLRDPAIVHQLNSRFVALKIDASRHSTLADFLKIQSFPTLVFATAQGRVLGSHEGYLEAPALKDQLERVLAATGDLEWMQRNFAEAARAREQGDFTKALGLLKPILEEGKDRPIYPRTVQQVKELEHLVKTTPARVQEPKVAQPTKTPEPIMIATAPRSTPAVPIQEQGPVVPPAPPQKPEPINPVKPAQPAVATRVAVVPPLPPLPAANQPAEPPQASQAVAAMAEFSKMLRGTFTSRRGAQMLITLASRTDSPEQVRVRHAQDLLYQAREDYQKQQYLACLDRCEMLLASYPDLSESLEAMQMAGEIRKNPEWVKLACDQLGDRLSVMYLNLAETWLAKGEPQQAIFYLERVIQTAPNTRFAETAQVRLTQLQGQPPNRPSDVRR